jgi:hypothetical protein
MHEDTLETVESVADMAVMRGSRRRTIVPTAAFIVGMMTFAGVRLPTLMDQVGYPTTAIWLLTLPIAVTYAAGATLGLILVRDRVIRWWWLPATLFLIFGAPVDAWIGWSAVSMKLGYVPGTAVDLVAILAPAGALILLTRPSGVRIHDRLVPAVLIAGVSVILAMRVGNDGPDASFGVAAALLALGTLSQSTSWRRAVVFVALAVALGSQIPASLANALSQRLTGPVAWVDASMDIAIALLAFSIAPLARVSRRMFASQSRRAIADSA